MAEKEMTNRPTKGSEPGERRDPTRYLNHGVDSLVAYDSPDDPQLGVPAHKTDGLKKSEV